MKLNTLASRANSNLNRVGSINKDFGGAMNRGITIAPDWQFKPDLSNVSRTTPQTLINNNDTLETMGSNTLKPSFVDGREVYEIYDGTTNLVNSPNDITGSNMGVSGATKESEKIFKEDSSLNAQHFLYSNSATFTSGVTYRQKIRFNFKNNPDNRAVSLQFPPSVIASAFITVSDEGNVLDIGSNIEDYIINVSDNFITIEVQTTAFATQAGQWTAFRITDGLAWNYDGNGATEVYVDFWQIEVGVISTPFVDGTRDNLIINDNDLLDVFNNTKGTFVLKFKKLPSISYPNFLRVSNLNGEELFIAMNEVNEPTQPQIYLGVKDTLGGTYVINHTTKYDNWYTLIITYDTQNDEGKVFLSDGQVNKASLQGKILKYPMIDCRIGTNTSNVATNCPIESLKYYAGTTFTDETLKQEVMK